MRRILIDMCRGVHSPVWTSMQFRCATCGAPLDARRRDAEPIGIGFAVAIVETLLA